ncbi:putative stage v sporulation protein k protein [Eutypa lata UCREL1]|uniref:Putative stage v sporulation protein k protein n=1 Tax=Eutypa lata (strain UCR-EL1) TaxID=1287681 RepID=M7TE89_EUTLA|nr:putative stage v sporulation protein k protein [Eutypa lata UCREL1]
MEAFFGHNPGIRSRIPFLFQFEDYDEDQLLAILKSQVQTKYGGLKNNKAWTELQAMTGLDKVKETVSSLIQLIEVNRIREFQDLPPLECNLNRVFLGNPGTGKTTVAKLYGQILVDLGMLSNGEVVVKNPSDFIGSALGGSQANTKQILEATKGKVLVIDEAYMLNQNTSKNGATEHVDPYKSDVIGTLVAEVQGKAGDDRCVLLLGYKDKMEDMFRDGNEGLQRRFQLQDAFNFEDFTADQMIAIWRFKTKKLGIECEPGVEDVAMEIIERQRNKMNFGNAGEVDNLLDGAKARYLQRSTQGVSTQGASTQSVNTGSTSTPYTFTGMMRLAKSDIDPEFDRVVQAGHDIDGLFSGTIGCDQIKETIKGYSKIATSSKETGIDVQVPMTFIFKGPPGTGKTTTARNIGSVFYSLGILGCRDVVEVSSNEMIGQYVGQTVPKVKRQMEAALGKVLFIDEAYRLSRSHFGTEAVEEIIASLTHPKFEKKLVVILAGYSGEMEDLMERKRELLDLSEPQSKKAKWEAAPKDTETPHEDWKELQEKKNEEKRIQDDKDREEKRKQREEEKKRRKEKKKREKEEREREEAKKREEQRKIQDEQRRQEQRRQEQLLQDQKRKDQQAQEKIRTMGRCVRGFAWNKVNGGWQCQGGSHFASDKELGL